MTSLDFLTTTICQACQLGLKSYCWDLLTVLENEKNPVFHDIDSKAMHLL